MTRIHSSLFILAIVLVVIVGCSQKHDIPTTPSETQISQNNPNYRNNLDNFVIPKDDSLYEAHELFGSWTASFDLISMRSSVIQDRTPAHINITNWIDPPVITLNSYDNQTGIADVDITLTNPFPVAAYDVRLIVFTDAVGHMLKNPDDWTPIHDIPGGWVINPFKAYAKDEPDRAFTGYGSFTENFQIYIAGDPNVQIAVDACYPDNCPEAYMIDNFVQDKNLPDYMASVDCTLDVEIYDDEMIVDDVRLYCPMITGGPMVEFSQVAPSKWRAKMANLRRVPAGEYMGVIIAKSFKGKAYDVVTITIEEAPPAEWTIFYYVYQENLCCIGYNINEQEVVGSVPGILNMIVLWDRTDTADDLILEIKTDTRGYNSSIISPRIEDYGEVIPDTGLEMPNPEQLRKFLNWGLREYPANKYGYIMLSHGNYGIYSHVPDRSFLDDMGVWEFRNAARSALDANGIDRLEFVGLECCTMSWIEAANKLADVCKVAWSSEYVMLVYSARYDQVLAELVANPWYEGSDFASLFVHNALNTGGAYTYAAWDSDLTVDVAIPAVNVFAQALIDHLPDYRDQIADCRLNSDNWGNECEDYRVTDLGLFCENILAYDPPLPVELTDAATVMRNAISTAVYDMGTNGTGTGCFYDATGWQILFTDRFNDPSEDYEYVRGVINDIGFADATLWDEFLSAYDINEY